QGNEERRNHKRHKRHKRLISFVPFVLFVVSSRCSTLSLEESMRRTGHLIKICVFVAALITPALAQTAVSNDPIKTLVDRLDLEKYKATIKGLTQFGDRREGTERNRRAIDWIEQQLKSYGCINTERLTYNYQPEARSRANLPPNTAAGGGRPRGVRVPTGVNTDPVKQRNA